DRGPGGSDRRQRLVVSYVWMLPQLTRMNRALRGVAGGWQLGGILTAQTGDGLTIVAGRDQKQTGLKRDRGGLAGGQSNYSSTRCGDTTGGAPRLNKGAFAPPPPAPF